jgi:hypothetical protein
VREENGDCIAWNDLAKTPSNRSKEVAKLQFRNQFVCELEQQPEAILAALQGVFRVLPILYICPSCIPTIDLSSVI